MAQLTASAAPKLPELASTTGMPGCSVPRSVAKASIVSARPSLEEPVAPPKSRYARMPVLSPVLRGIAVQPHDGAAVDVLIIAVQDGHGGAPHFP